MSEDGPKNRKERRAAAKETGKPIASPTSAPKIKLHHPDRSAPRATTLMDLYEEKRGLLDHGQPFEVQREGGLALDPSGNILEAGLGDDDDPIGPVGNAIFYSITLTIVHFTLDVLVYSQYMQEIEWGAIFQRTLIALPALLISLLLLGSQTAMRFPLARQMFFFGLGVGAGCYVIHAANVYGYFAVMKQAPPLGTLWIWSVVEMRLPFAVGSLGANLAFLLYKGYSFI